MSEHKDHGHIKSFVLRQARMTRAQEEAIETLSDKFCVKSFDEVLNFEALFGNKNPVILEIGFGMGHATAIIAKQNQDINYLAVEVHGPGVGALLKRIDEEHITNIRIVQRDVVLVLSSMIAHQSLSGVHIFFPDPWPKKKHHKRRLIQSAFLDNLRTYCKPNAYVYLATDWEDYAEHMLVAIKNATHWSAQGDGYITNLDWRPRTSFEHKGLQKAHVIREIMCHIDP